MREGIIALQSHAQKANHLCSQTLKMPVVDQQLHDAQCWRPAPSLQNYIKSHVVLEWEKLKLVQKLCMIKNQGL